MAAALSEFRQLQNRLEAYLSDGQIAQIEKAYQVAEHAHREQRRSSGEPYITHPLAVAEILAGIHLDAESIMAAILHDVIEDTHIDKEELMKEFGEDVSELVDGVSKLTQIKFESKAEAQAANFRKMMMAMSKDIRVIIIKLADRLHNMRTLGHLRPEKRRRIARETLEIYAPIANRLGMRSFRDELQGLGFQMLYPYRYRVLKEAVKKARGNRKEILSVIEGSLNKSLIDSGVTNFQFYGREKNLYSIYRKMRDKQLHFSEIMDVYAFRIITDGIGQCYRALGVVHNAYKPVPERFKDYIAIPKANGYQSLHTILFGPYGVPIEIQVRTYEMDQMAENGIAAHWLYKAEDPTTNHAHFRAREWIKRVLEIQQSAGNSLEFIENVKIDLFPDEVYVFTPQGEIMELPAGATTIDFAYAVHSDIGNSCIAAKIDRRLEPLSTSLKSGQKVEIITAPGATPNPAWLSFVATAKARTNIRHVLKKQQCEESIALGRRLLISSLKKLNVELDELSDARRDIILSFVGSKTFDDLLEDIGLGNQMAPVIAKRLVQTDLQANELPASENEFGEKLMIKGTEGMAVSYAKCCSPIPGDPVFGVLTRGRGVVVHADFCGNCREFHRKHPDKCISMCWADDAEGEFQVGLTVEMDNRRGALATLALAVADAQSNMSNIIVDEMDAQFVVFHLLVSVSGRINLAKVIRRIRKITHVRKVFRERNYSFK